ncbi:hypothetical protein pb186bvf_015529 [Paramecium bursaria]
MIKEKKFEPIKMPLKVKAKHHLKKKQQNLSPQDNIQFSGEKDKQSISYEILTQGYVQSYTDFFYITYQSIPLLFHASAQMSLFDHFNIKEVIYRIYLLKVKHQQINQSQDFLEDLKRSLIQAEESTRYQLPDRSAALEGYLILAEQFQNNHQDYIVSAYFYKRVINIARQCNEQQFEGKGRLGYGKCHYQVGLIDQSINILEESQKLCEELGLETVSEQMSGQLIQIYNKMASEYEKGEGEQINQALHYYEKCREAAQKSGNYEAEGMICHKIGGLFLKMGNLQRSIQYQSKFLDIVKAQHKDDSKQKEMEAHASLAKCYIKKGDIDEAQKHLDQYHILAKDQKLHNAQSDAGLMLAKLHQQKGNTAKSLEYFQQHFDCAKSEKSENKNRKLIDEARVTYAIAKANAYIDNYIKLVANSDKNLKALLDWKLKKDK